MNYGNGTLDHENGITDYKIGITNHGNGIGGKTNIKIFGLTTVKPLPAKIVHF